MCLVKAECIHEMNPYLKADDKLQGHQSDSTEWFVFTSVFEIIFS